VFEPSTSMLAARAACVDSLTSSTAVDLDGPLRIRLHGKGVYFNATLSRNWRSILPTNSGCSQGA
jgi:hypothetical protein